MKKIKSYYSFLLESILYVNDDLVSILKKIDHPIANILLELIGKDIKLNFNALKASSKNDMIDFLPDSRVKEEPTDWNKSKNSIKVGRIVKDILQSNGHKEFLDKDIEAFVTKYKAAFDSGSAKDRFKIVKGLDIKKWYLYTNNSVGDGTLQKSCMRYKRCEEYFGIYTDNEDKCNMVILFNENSPELIDARALIWYPTYSSNDYYIYVDRIYYTKEEQCQLIIDWIKAKFADKQIAFYNLGKVGSLEVQIDKTQFDYYPYMDTFTYLDGDILNNSENGDTEMTNTDGSTSQTYVNRIYSELEDEYFNEDEVIYIESRESYVHEENARYCSYLSEYFWHEDVVFSTYLDDYLREDDAVHSNYKESYLLRDDCDLVFTNKEKTDEDYYPNDELNDTYAKDEDSDDYYVIDLLERTGDGNMALPENIIICYEDINAKDTYWTEIDAKLFNIELDKLSIEKFSKNEYFSDSYVDKIFVKEYKIIEDLIKSRLKLQEDIEAANKFLEQYKDWHDKKMSFVNTKYWRLQKLYEFGGWENLIKLKKRLFMSNFKKLVSDDYFKTSIDQFKQYYMGTDNFVININYNHQLTNTNVSKEIDLSKTDTDEIYAGIYPQFISMCIEGMSVKSCYNRVIQRQIMSGMTDNDGLFYQVIFDKISNAFYMAPEQIVSNWKDSIDSPFLKWYNKNWIDYLYVSNDLDTNTIYRVNAELN